MSKTMSNRCANRFEVFGGLDSDEESAEMPKAPVHMVEMFFPCFSGVVGQLIGAKGKYLEELRTEYRKRFEGRRMSVTYDGMNFRVHLEPHEEGMAFVALEFGRRVALANEGIIAEPAGAIIGKKGWWLKHLTKQVYETTGNKCTVYHEDGAFFVKFPWNVESDKRVEVMDIVRRKLVGRSTYLTKTFSESDSMSTRSSVESLTTEEDLESLFSTMSPTPSEAYDDI